MSAIKIEQFKQKQKQQQKTMNSEDTSKLP